MKEKKKALGERAESQSNSLIDAKVREYREEKRRDFWKEIGRSALAALVSSLATMLVLYLTGNLI